MCGNGKAKPKFGVSKLPDISFFSAFEMELIRSKEF
jgi:hypothetical protein